MGRCGVALQPLVDALREELMTQAILHADETPVPMLAPGKKKTHQAYVWAYASTRFDPLQAVIYEFAPSRAGKHARAFFQGWQGKLVCDDFAGYKAGFEQGMTEIACWAHARRKFYDLHASGKSTIAEQALGYIGQLYEIEAETKALTATERQTIRQARAGADHRRVVHLVDRPATAGAQGFGDQQGDPLQPETLACSEAIPGRRRGADRQQLGGKPGAAVGAWAEELVVCRFTAQWPAWGCHHEPDPVGENQRA